MEDLGERVGRKPACAVGSDLPSGTAPPADSTPRAAEMPSMTRSAWPTAEQPFGNSAPSSEQDVSRVHAIYHREVHYWTEGRAEPPCGTLEERFDWSDAVDDVSCELCREALERETKAGHGYADGGDEGEHAGS